MIPVFRSATTIRGNGEFFPFGRYAGPIDEFPGRYQADYAELFQHAQPMDFGIGYRWRSYESNLLLSVRLPSDGPGAADVASSAPSVEPRPPRAKRPEVEDRRGFFFWR